MFPIPFNFPFRKKDGTITTMDDAISSGGGGGYELPTASANTKGGIKIGVGLTMDGEVLNNSNPAPPSPYVLPTASDETLGGVKVGSGLSIDESGVLSASGGGGGLDYVDVTIAGSTHVGGTFSTDTFQPPSELVGKRVVCATFLEGTGSYSNIYPIGIGRMSDPVISTDWIYVLSYNKGSAESSGTITKIRVFYV